MENEQLEQQVDNSEYIETIKKMKETMVPREELLKVKQENKQLLSTILEGGELEAAATAQEKRTPDEIRKELFGDNAENLTNLQFAEKALELRKAILDEGGIDPFVPQGNKIMAEESDYAAAEKVAKALQSCIEYADGNNDIFTNELMRITADIAPISTRAKKPTGNRR